MLQIKTIKNPLVTDESKDSYCFRSTCSQTLKTAKLAKEMTDWNSSFTEADYLGMFSVMEAIVVKHLAKGYSVELPFGTLRANATGTCANIQDGFTPGIGNHTLGFLFNASDSATATVKDNLEFKQIPPDSTGEAKIYRVTSLQNDASESSLLNVTGGKALRLHGRNLRFDITDSSQGVFLENESGLIRMETYNRRGSNIVDTVIPSSISAGNYSISIVTKPGNKYFTANIDSEITVA